MPNVFMNCEVIHHGTILGSLSSLQTMQDKQKKITQKCICNTCTWLNLVTLWMLIFYNSHSRFIFLHYESHFVNLLNQRLSSTEQIYYVLMPFRMLWATCIIAYWLYSRLPLAHLTIINVHVQCKCAIRWWFDAW